MIRADRAIDDHSNLRDHPLRFFDIVARGVQFHSVEASLLRNHKSLDEAVPVANHADLQGSVEATIQVARGESSRCD